MQRSSKGLQKGKLGSASLSWQSDDPKFHQFSYVSPGDGKFAQISEMHESDSVSSVSDNFSEGGPSAAKQSVAKKTVASNGKPETPLM